MVFNTATTIYGTIPSKAITAAPKTRRTKVLGMGFPAGSRLEGGYFTKESGIQLVKNNLKQLLLTERGERVMLPNFGCNLRKFIFQPLDETTFEEIKEEILTSIENYTRGVEVLKLRIQEDNEARAIRS